MKKLTKGRYLFWGSIVLMLTLFIGITPGVAHAVEDEPQLDYLYFSSDDDENFITGETKTIYFNLFDEDDNSYKGAGAFYAAIIEDETGESKRYTYTGGSSISNVTLDKAGDYTLYISDDTGSARGGITVRDAKVEITGQLSLNYDNTIKVRVVDSDGNVLPRKSISVDASEVGGAVSNYTTIYDGTFSFRLIPTKMGTVKLTFGGHVIGSLKVTPAYSMGSRIGDNASNNATRSALVAQEGWSSSRYAILTRDDVVADAMVAVPLAKKYDAPIFMTPTNQLDSSVLNELQSLNVETVFVIGGDGAISSAVVDQLSSYGIYTNRIAGADRYETAAQIGYWVGSPGTVYLAYGYGEPDALAASALAAEQGIPILLTDTDALSESTAKELASLAPHNLILLGGNGVISAGLEQSLNQGYRVERWGGVDRYATQQIIFQNYFADQKAVNSFPAYFTSSYVLPSDVGGGTPYGDALFTAALAAKNQGFVITLPPNEIPSSIRTFLLYNKVFIPSSTVVGNSAAISYQVEAELNQLLAR